MWNSISRLYGWEYLFSSAENVETGRVFCYFNYGKLKMYIRGNAKIIKKNTNWK